MQSKCEINESPIEYLEPPDRDGAEHKEEFRLEGGWRRPEAPSSSTAFLPPASPWRPCAPRLSAASGAGRCAAPAGGPACPPARPSPSSSGSPASACDGGSSSWCAGWSAPSPPGPPLQQSRTWSHQTVSIRVAHVCVCVSSIATHVVLVVPAVRHCRRLLLLFQEAPGVLQHLLHLDQLGCLGVTVPSHFQHLLLPLAQLTVVPAHGGERFLKVVPRSRRQQQHLATLVQPSRPPSAGRDDALVVGASAVGSRRSMSFLPLK